MMGGARARLQKVRKRDFQCLRLRARSLARPRVFFFPILRRLSLNISFTSCPPPRLSLSLSSPSQEYKEFLRSAGGPSPRPGPDGYSLSPDGDNLFAWTAVLAGPEGTPYAGGEFDLVLSIPDAYPMAPPSARFVTRIFHPPIHFKTGDVCMDVLKAAWSPAWTLAALCTALRSLLAHPAPDSPLNCDAGNLLRAGDERGFGAMARLYTVELAAAGRPRRASSSVVAAVGRASLAGGG